LSVLLALIVFLVTFNSIRLAIYSSREEINVMKLVGASKWFIRGPFFVEGLLYGLVATVVTILILYPLFYFLSPKISGFLPIGDVFSYFRINLLSFFLLLLGVGVFLGGFSTMVAVRKYLKE
jgi:cell division transport system permease protein